MTKALKNNIHIIFVLLLCLPLLVNAQSGSYIVKGQIVDSALIETIPFATVKLTSKEDPKTVLKAFAADEDGKFEFSVNRGEYLIGVQYIGKDAYSAPISVGNDKVLDLGKLPIKTFENELGEVTVTAQKPLVKVDLDKITYSFEADPEAKTTNVLEMLRKVPLVTVDGDDEIQLKGSANYKIYLDGKPSAMIASNPKDVLKSMPASSIKDIEIITDPGAKYDAEGVTGIINIITNKNSSLGGYTVSVNAGGSTQKDFSGGTYLTMKYGKIGFTGNFNYYEYNPSELPSRSFRETFAREGQNGVLTEPAEKYFSFSGRNKNKGSGLYGGGQLSYEIDTLNLIQVSYNTYGGDGKYNSRGHYLMENIDGVPQFEYNGLNNGKYKYGTNTFGADYQRTFSVKDRLLTLSYRLNSSPKDSDSENYSEDINIMGYRDERRQQYNDGNSYEHTGQVDFTTPIAKIHTLETGMKYIRRVSKSNSGKYNWDPTENSWTHYATDNDKFKYDQDILAAYAGYSVKVKQWGFKTGIRYEGTWQKALFPINADRNFSKDYSNFIPSATVSYQLKPGQTLRAGYNMSIRRPGLWHLNPYENTSDEFNVRKGNPDLEAVKFHSANVNYTFFNPKFNMNANVSYSFANNEIDRVSYIENGVAYETYDNIGKNRNLYVSLYANWSPNPKFRLYGNLGGSYYNIQENSMDKDQKKLKNKGFRPQATSGVQYTLPWQLKSAVNGGYYGAWRSLTSKGPYFYYYSLSLSKSFIKDKLDIRLYASNPFQANREMKFTTETLTYRTENWNTRRMRSFGINVSFRFGEMKEQIKKAARGISNTDQMGGGQGEGNEGGGGQN